MHIVHVAPEMVPFAKVGGLGDVVGSLPLAQARNGHEVSVVLPGYRRILEFLGLASMDGTGIGYRIDNWEIRGSAVHFRHEGVRIVLICHDEFFDRPGIYGTSSSSYDDNGLRYAWFAGAALSALRQLERAADVIVAHDWPAGLAPLFLRVHRFPGDPLWDTASVQVIHNLAHQGLFPMDLARRLQLPEYYLGPRCLEIQGNMSMLKGGILSATKVVTVSPTYAEEIVWPALGEGLDRDLLSRGDDLVGILNGLDTKSWDPQTDPFIEAPYSAAKPAGKKRCKLALQHELGLLEDTSLPLVGIVSRVDPQKGIDLVEHVAPSLVERRAQFVLLGSGQPGLLDPLHGLAAIWSRSVSCNERFDEGLAHRIYAGADFFLMPSRFEPCGLGQLVALRYGAIPIVRRTGGLADTVLDIEEYPERGNGFVFETPDAGGLRWATDRALDFYAGDRKLFARIRKRGMREDLSWDNSAKDYDRMLSRARLRESRRVMA